MAKIHTTIPRVTRKQLEWLVAAGYGTQSAALQEAVSRLYQAESTLIDAPNQPTGGERDETHGVAAEA